MPDYCAGSYQVARTYGFQERADCPECGRPVRIYRTFSLPVNIGDHRTATENREIIWRLMAHYPLERVTTT